MALVISDGAPADSGELHNYYGGGGGGGGRGGNSNLVNRFGYPRGEGSTLEEQRGPYLYILTRVKQIHYEENEVYYTVTREDNGEDVRGDAGK
jgi:hypothetical protein